MTVKVVYENVDELETTVEKAEKDILSCAGRLLELVNAQTVIVSVDDYDKPVVYAVCAPVVDGLDYVADRFVDEMVNSKF